MKHIVVFGAGMVAGAHVDYLLNVPDFHVTVASRTLSKAQALVSDHPRGRAVQVNSDDEAALEALIAEADLAVSLLPYAYHPTVARLCIKHGTHMVTTSYVKEAMAQLDGAARAAGVILLNEIGVDPGIDHMTAMRIVHGVQAKGGRVTKFVSWCGGLPAPEANDNPFGYKFSWSPRGVLLAGKNSAHFLWDGQDVVIPGGELFDHYWTVPVEVQGKVMDFDGYPNRDSLPYMQTYGIENPQTFFRGTLRYPGWCQTLRKIADLGLLEETPLAGLDGADLRPIHRAVDRQRRPQPARCAGRLSRPVAGLAGDRQPGLAGLLERRTVCRPASGSTDRHPDRTHAGQDAVRARRAGHADPAAPVRGRIPRRQRAHRLDHGRFRPPPRLHQHGPHRRPAGRHRRQADPARPDRA